MRQSSVAAQPCWAHLKLQLVLLRSERNCLCMTSAVERRPPLRWQTSVVYEKDQVWHMADINLQEYFSRQVVVRL